MFEVMGRTNGSRVGVLPGSTYAGELLTDVAASAIVNSVKCLNPECDAAVQFVRGTSVRRAHFRHRPGNAVGFTVGSPTTEWHRWVQYDLFAGAYAHEHAVQGALIDAVVQRVNSKSLSAIEVQHSPIETEVVLRRHQMHRTAGIAGTVWVVDAKHLDYRDRIKTRWVADLVTACLETPVSDPGTPGYGCVVGFLDLDPKAPEDQTLRFIDTIAFEDQAGRPAIRITSWGARVSPEAVRM